jgi:hypothetical protein
LFLINPLLYLSQKNRPNEPFFMPRHFLIRHLWLACCLFAPFFAQGQAPANTGSRALRGAGQSLRQLEQASQAYQTAKTEYEKALEKQKTAKKPDSAHWAAKAVALARQMAAAGERAESLARQFRGQLGQSGLGALLPTPEAGGLGTLPSVPGLAQARPVAELLRQVERFGDLRPLHLADSLARAQYQQALGGQAGRWFWGGDFGLALGSQKTYVNVSPLAGYRLGQRVSVGGGTVLQYLKMSVLVVDPEFGHHRRSQSEVLVYGARGFARLAPFGGPLLKNLFAQAEIEAVNAGLPQTDGSRPRHWVPGAMAGGGYQLGLGRGISLNLVATYNFLYRPERSPYGGPLDFRVGVQF